MAPINTYEDKWPEYATKIYGTKGVYAFRRIDFSDQENDQPQTLEGYGNDQGPAARKPKDRDLSSYLVDGLKRIIGYDEEGFPIYAEDEDRDVPKIVLLSDKKKPDETPDSSPGWGAPSGVPGNGPSAKTPEPGSTPDQQRANPAEPGGGEPAPTPGLGPQTPGNEKAPGVPDGQGLIPGTPLDDYVPFVKLDKDSPQTGYNLDGSPKYSWQPGLKPDPPLAVRGPLRPDYDAYLSKISNKVEGVQIDRSLYEGEEGGLALKAYIPLDKDGNVRDASGTTAGKGVDLGHMNEKSLLELGLRPGMPLYEKLLPYLGKRREEAANFLKENPLELTRKEAEWLSESVFNQQLRQIERGFNRATKGLGGKTFTELAPAVQSVLFSVMYQRGVKGTRDHLPGLMEHAAKGEYVKMAKTLLKDKYYISRRTREAERLYDPELYF